MTYLKASVTGVTSLHAKFSSSWSGLADRIARASQVLSGSDEIEVKQKEIERLLADLTEFKENTNTKPSTALPCTKVQQIISNSIPSNSPKATTITPRIVDYSAWYSDVITAADLVDQSPVRGCMVIKPWGMAIWDAMRAELDQRIRSAGVSNAYFPLFIPLHFLAKEAEHVDGFAKECAVVTHHRLITGKDGILQPDSTAKLEEPLVIRPTSETIIWNMFSKWIGSHRDLPMKINQWANVVRWEMRTRPFLRTSEFLWQEGHTAHSSTQDALQMTFQALEIYADVCKELLAMPTIKGEKSPSERFAGAENTYTIEALMQNGWALQSGTSHYLGQKFAKAFDVQFQNEHNQREYVWATSWGVSTRLVGAMIMTHSDDKGLVLPPKVAPQQIVIVPVGSDKDSKVTERANELATSLRDHGIRAIVDNRETLRPGAKYFEWERKGVPLRLELGPKDMVKGQVTAAVRHTGAKLSILDDENLFNKLNILLDEIQNQLYDKALERVDKQTFRVTSYSQMKSMLSSQNNDEKGFYLVPWKCDAGNEKLIKEECKATIRCYPFVENQLPLPSSVKCFFSGDQATHMALFARAY